MYTQIFLLIIFILVVNLAPEMSSGFWDLTKGESLLISTVLYFGLLVVIYLQSRWARTKRLREKQAVAFLTQLELIGYFIFIYLILGVQTHFPWLYMSDTVLSVISLFFYLLALSVLRMTLKLKSQIFFLIPFLIPYFILTVSLDLFDWTLGIREGWLPTGIALLLLFVSLLFLPFFIQIFWNCTPLTDDALHERLEKLCQRARFKHGGMSTWTVLPNAITAGIIGVIPRFRYVMFTPKLLQMLAPQQIEAILAHEIGHSKHKHLILYPFIILGMGISVALFFVFFETPIADFLNGSSISALIDPLVVFIPYALIMWLYFRFVFGYFSRLFERQADLYVFQLGIPPEDMISALDHIAIASGNIHNHPSWHHFSIKQRIAYLEKVMENPSLISRHHRKVAWSLIAYFLILALGIFILFWY